MLHSFSIYIINSGTDQSTLNTAGPLLFSGDCALTGQWLWRFSATSFPLRVRKSHIGALRFPKLCASRWLRQLYL